MASIKCKNCGKIVDLDKDKNINQAYVFCNWCGYSSNPNPYFEKPEEEN